MISMFLIFILAWARISFTSVSVLASSCQVHQCAMDGGIDNAIMTGNEL